MDKIDPNKAKVVNEKDLPKEIPKKISREELKKRIRNKRNVMNIKRKSKYALFCYSVDHAFLMFNGSAYCWSRTP